MTTASVVLTLIVTLAAGCSFGAPDEEQLLGRWRVESFNGDAVAVGVNTSEWPALEFVRSKDTFLASGSLGCNTFGANYEFDGATLVFGEGSTTAMACVPDRPAVPGDEDAAMRAETEISEVLFSPPVGVEFDGDDRTSMILRSAGGEIVLERLDVGPDGGEADAAPPVGPLECDDGRKVEEHLVGSGLSQADAARGADPAVVRTDNNLYTTFGFDGDGTMIVEVQNTDSAPGDYLVYTCSDD